FAHEAGNLLVVEAHVALNRLVHDDVQIELVVRALLPYGAQHRTAIAPLINEEIFLGQRGWFLALLPFRSSHGDAHGNAFPRGRLRRGRPARKEREQGRRQRECKPMDDRCVFHSSLPTRSMTYSSA